MTDLPTIITTAGLQPQAPADIRDNIVALVTAENPGYTANLPGSLVEDVLSTEVAGVALCDSARVDTVNSLTPFAINAFLLNSLGQTYGVQLGQETNTSVFCVFTGNPGFVIPQGFTVSDGQFQYIVRDGGVIGSANVSSPIFCLAALPGVWAVPSGTVNEIVTSVPAPLVITVTNSSPGTPGSPPQTEESYRAQVLQAGQAIATGMPTMLKTLLGNVSGVQPRLISVLQSKIGPGWEIICGGGDPFEVGFAIYSALFDISILVGSQLLVAGITNANPGVVSTTLNHGYVTGQVINISGIVGMPELNDIPLVATVIDENDFSIGVNTSSFPDYVSGGIVTPNLRNITATLIDYPNTYDIPFVNPPQETVTIAVTWNTTAVNFVSQAAVEQLAQPALVDYVNSISTGNPMNLYELQTTFQTAIAAVLPSQLLTRMVFDVSINGVGVPPEAGTGIIPGDPESFFFAVSTGITITQG